MNVLYLRILQIRDFHNERSELAGYASFKLLLYFYMVSCNYLIVLPSVFFCALSICHPVLPLLHITQSLGLIQPKE